MSGSVRYLSAFMSDLGDALFRGNDVHSRELRSIVGELQDFVLTNKLQPNLNGLSQALGNFLPARIRDNPVNDYWYQRDLENWNSVQKPTIITALEAYFIDGGKEGDAKDISACINLIENHGITIECKDKLINELSSGDWRSKLAQIAMQGRVLVSGFIPIILTCKILATN